MLTCIWTYLETFALFLVLLSIYIWIGSLRTFLRIAMLWKAFSADCTSEKAHQRERIFSKSVYDCACSKQQTGVLIVAYVPTSQSCKKLWITKKFFYTRAQRHFRPYRVYFVYSIHMNRKIETVMSVYPSVRLLQCKLVSQSQYAHKIS